MSGEAVRVGAAKRRELLEHLAVLYPEEATRVLPELLMELESFAAQHSYPTVPADERLTENDVVLITYGDQVRTSGEAPLLTLRRLLTRHLRGTVTAIHLLPFFPYSSDDGFSVIDHRQVDPALGSWKDIAALHHDYRLMFDAVVNHISASSSWFRVFLADKLPYRDYFLVVEPGTDLGSVVRPRTTPLLTAFETSGGTRHLWTTFGSDQIDLDYHNPRVLIDIIRILLFYVSQGADILRLDAVTYLWKQLGTSCANHPNTHRVVKLFRSVLEAVAPHVVLLTETNVPHAENLSYFGNGRDEAQMIYNFALPPLTLHSLLSGDAGHLQEWAASLASPSRETTFFNFLASHDGIGLRPVEGILEPSEIQRLIDSGCQRGGLVSSRRHGDGSESPYELNINLYDALNDPTGAESLEIQVRRFMTAQAIMLSLSGVPGIYAHSLLGSRGAPWEVARSGEKRSINREKLALAELERELTTPGSRRARVLRAFRDLLGVRRTRAAFHPNAEQVILETPPGVFGLLRAGRNDEVVCLHNVAGGEERVEARLLPTTRLRDLVSGDTIAVERNGLLLQPWQTLWLEPQ